MQSAPLSDDEIGRLTELQDYEILDTPPEESFDNLTRLASQICGTPIALVSLVDSHRQWFKAKVGIDAPETPREIAFCAHAILGHEPLIIPDTAQDKRFADNPLVTADPHIRFYAGMPLITPTGHAMGTLCVIDRVPRQLTTEQTETLRMLGRQVVQLLELKRRQKELEQALVKQKENEQANRDIVRAIEWGLEGVAFLDQNGCFTFMNRAHAAIFGYQPEELIGRSWKTLYEPEWASRIEQEYFPVLLETGHWTGLLQGQSGSGTTIHVEVSLVLAEQAQDLARWLMCTCREVTGRVMVQQALESKHRSMADAQSIAQVGSWEWNIDTGAEIWSDEQFRIFGYEPHAISPTIDTFRDALHPDDRDRVLTAVGSTLDLGHPYELICRIVRPSGETRHVLCRGTVTRQSAGRPQRMMGTVQDVTEQRTMESLLNDSLQRLNLATTAGGIGVWDYYVRENKLVWDTQMHQLYGYTPEDCPGSYEAWTSRLHPEDRPYAEAMLQSALAGRSHFNTEFRLSLPDGTIRHIKASAVIVKDDQGQAVRMIGVNYDISAQRTSEQALLKVQGFQEAILFNAPHAVIATTVTGMIQHFNPAAEKLLGYAAGEVIGKLTPAAFHNSEEVAARAKIFGTELGLDLEPGFDVLVAKARRNLPNQHEWIYIRKDGTRIPVLLSVTAIRDHTGSIAGFLGMATDISAQKKAERVRLATEAALREKEELTRAMIENVLDYSILRLDSEGHVMSWNQGSQRLKGYAADEIIGRHFSCFYTEDDQACGKPTTLLRRATAHHHVEDEGWRVKKDGSRFWANVVITALFDQDGTLRGFTKVVRDLTERHEVKVKREEQEARLRAIVDQAVDGIITIGERGTIETFNRSAESMFGYSAVEVIGQNVHVLMPEPYKSEHDGYLANYHRTGEAKIIGIGREVLGRRKDGSTFPLDLAVSETRLDNRRFYTGLVRDITERRAAEEKLAQTARELESRNRELAEANQSALAATRAKSEFLATMSHEIRTPMNAIVGMAELLEETPLTPDQANYVGRFSRAAASLMELINTILDLSKIESGHMALESVPFDLPQLVDSIADLMTGKALAKGLELLIHVHPHLPRGVVGDPTRLRQVLTNLVGNAVKFTESGHVMIKIEPAPTQASCQALRFAVSDTGIGIPQDKLQTVFEAFTQVDSTTTRKYGGTGLGLSISQQLVAMMGGQLCVNSEVGAGTTFSFVIDMPEAPLLEADRHPHYLDVHGRCILVVDDNETNRMIVREHLSRAGVTLIEAASGAEALRILDETARRNESFDVAIVDYHMPGMDGLALSEAIRARPEWSAMPIIMHVSDLQRDDAQRAKSLGIANYLYKPLNRRRLMESLALVLDLVEPTETYPASADPPDMSTLSPYYILLAEDLEDNRDVVKLFLKDTPYQLEMAVNGAQALEQFKNGTYDLVLMDMQMPVMDGLEATAAIRQWERDQRRTPTPIIALTANAFKEEADRSLAAGCTAHMTKPIKKKTLLTLIAQCAGRAQDRAA
ncbi:MAG: PAS domain S-box protein [Nitrospira sp.]|nr:PAS domain S-box protein [Nitrospira sp.]